MHQYKERDGEEDRQPGGHVKRREEGCVLRRMLDALVPGKRWRGRQTTRSTCQEKGRRVRAKKNVRCTTTGKRRRGRQTTRWTCQEKGRRVRAKKNVKMHQYQERDGEEDRQPGGHVKRRDEGCVLRRMLDAPLQERDGEEDRQPGGHVKRREEGCVLRRMLRCTSTRKETERKTDNQVDMSREGKKGAC